MLLDTRFISIDPRQIAEVTALTSAFGNKFNVAMQAAISRTLKPTAVKMFSDRVKDTINLPVAEIKKQVAVKLPSFTRLVGTITMSRKGVPLKKYMSGAQLTRAMTLKSKVKGKQTRFRRFRPGGGLSFKVYKGGPVEYAPAAFVAASTKNAFIGVWTRVLKKGFSAADWRKKKSGGSPSIRVKRYSIRLMQGPTAVGVLAHAPGKNAATILDEIQVALGPVLQKNVGQQITRLITAPQTFSAFKGYTES